MACLLVLFSLAAVLISASASALPNQASKPKFHLVKSPDDLWRFQTGASAAALSVGKEYVCILSNRNKFLAARQGKVYNDRDWCQREERFKVEFTSSGDTLLKRYSSSDAVSCLDNGDATLVQGKGPRQKFKLYVDETDDRLLFYNAFTKKYLMAHSNGKVRCEGTTRYEERTWFKGWKWGSKTAWTASDAGVFYKSFDNSGSRKIKKFDYKKTVGVKTVKSSKAGTRGTEPVSLNGLSSVFKKNFVSHTETDWASEPSKVWSKSRQEEATVTVYPDTILKLYQIIGYYGPFQVYSDEFLEVELPGKPSETQATT